MKNSLFPNCWYVIVLLILLSIRPVYLSAAITEISDRDMDTDMVCQDMESCPVGPISGTHSCFTSIFLREAILLGEWSDDDDILNSGPVGNALCCFMDELTIAEPDDEIYDPDLRGAGYRFELAAGVTAKQLSFRPVDQMSWTAEISVYAGGLLLDTITKSITAYDSLYFESSDSFDAFEITTSAGTGGWCVDDLCIASFDSMTSTPTPTVTPTPTATSTIAPVPEGTIFSNGILIIFFGLVVLNTLGSFRLN
jgi:hypothetical protein